LTISLVLNNFYQTVLTMGDPPHQVEPHTTSFRMQVIQPGQPGNLGQDTEAQPSAPVVINSCAPTPPPAPQPPTGPDAQIPANPVSSNQSQHVQHSLHDNGTHLDNISKRETLSKQTRPVNPSHLITQTSHVAISSSLSCPQVLLNNTHSADVTRAKKPPTKRRRPDSTSSLESSSNSSIETEGYSTPQLQINLMPRRSTSAIELAPSRSLSTPNRRPILKMRRSTSLTAPHTKGGLISSFFKSSTEALSCLTSDVNNALALVPISRTASLVSLDNSPRPSTSSMNTDGTTHTPSHDSTNNTVFNDGATNHPTSTTQGNTQPPFQFTTGNIPITISNTAKSTKGNSPNLLDSLIGSFPITQQGTPQSNNQLLITVNQPGTSKRVSFQTNHTTSDTSTDTIPSLSLQDEGRVVSARAEEFWRKARNNLSAEAKAKARMLHIQQMIAQEVTPPWAIGMESLPGYLQPCMPDILRLRQLQAQEMLHTARDALRQQANEHDHTGRVYLTSCQNIYGTDVAGWTTARQRLASLLGTERAETISALARRLETLKATPITEDEISNHLTRGLPTPNFRNNQNRRRSRSPQPGTSSSSSDQNQEPTNRDSNRGQSQSNRGRGRGRSPRPRSNSRGRSTRAPPRGRGYQGNNRGRQGNNYSNRGTNSNRSRGQNNQRGNQSTRNYNGGSGNRQDDVSEAEIRAFIRAFRNQRQ